MIASRIAAAVAVALVLAGCDAETSENGPVDKARSTTEAFLAKCAAKDALAVANLLTETTRATFIAAGDTLEGCSELTKLGGVGPPPEPSELQRTFADATVEEAEVNAGFGAATIAAPGGLRSTIELEEVHGRWHIANPLPADPTPEAPPREDAEKAVADYLAACADEDAVAAGYILVPKAEREAFVESDDVLATCGETVAWDGGEPPEDLAAALAEAEVAEVTVEGTSATATIETPDGGGELELEVLESRWLLAPPVPPN
jgi:hypothetical protein